MKRVFTILFSLTTLLAAAQQGTVRGTVMEAATGEPLIGVTVLIEGTTTGTTTDLDGHFSLSLEPGIYHLLISYVSYQTVSIPDTEVKAGEVTVLEKVMMEENSQQLQTVVVSAEATRKSETALLAMKMNSVAIMDGISTEKMELTGDATAVEAAQRVTGVSIEGGKYVYVRGLGDRYSKTTLNNLEIPGLDPDRNSIQMDIFPTNLIDNLIVRKNFTADMSADFTGGLMNIETKAFPEEKFWSVSIGTSYNPQMHFRSDYLSYKGGSTDFLGFDDGTRSLPIQATAPKIPTPVSGHTPQEVHDFVSRFNPELAATNGFSLMDFSSSVAFGNQIELNPKNNASEFGYFTPKLGYTFSLSYKTEFTHYDDVVYGEYQRVLDAENIGLQQATLQEGALSKQNVLIGAMGGLAYKSQQSKYRLMLMRLQNGESTAGKFTINNNGAAVGQSGYTAVSDILEYNQRSVTNLLLNGSHVMDATGWEIDWRLAPTFSTSYDPDLRRTAFTYAANDTFFSAGAGGNPSRIWRSLSELTTTGRVDFTKNYNFLGNGAKLKFGASHTYKLRDYEILYFDIQFFGSQSWSSPDPALVLAPENIYPNKPNSIYYQSGNGDPNSNAYQSNVQNTGWYVSNEFTPVTRLRTIVGLRAENYVQRHTGRDQRYASGDVENGHNLQNEKVLESFDLFPSVIAIYSLTEKQNLRASYSKTIARPSFKELSYAQIIDPITNRIFNGGLFTYSDWNGQLVETAIQNLDLRWELFLESGEMISVSGFYKHFDNPIELVRIQEQQTSTEYQPRNVGQGALYGAEVEIRKNLHFLMPSLQHFNFDVNVTWVHSQIDMTASEFNARKAYAKSGEPVSSKRQMAGQSPYVINAGLTYSNTSIGLDAGLFYNVKGETLEIVGGGLFPDIYLAPFHSLNLGINKKLGKSNTSVIAFKASNLLDQKRESLYTAFGTEDQPYSSWSLGRSFSIGWSKKF